MPYGESGGFLSGLDLGKLRYHTGSPEDFSVNWVKCSFSAF